MEKPIKGSNIPFINLSKENLRLICDMLEGEGMLELFNSLYDYIYNGTEPNLSSKVLKSVWNNVMSVIERKSESYFSRKQHMDNINKKKKEANKENATENVSSIEETSNEEEFEMEGFINSNINKIMCAYYQKDGDAYTMQKDILLREASQKFPKAKKIDINNMIEDVLIRRKGNKAS